MKIDLTKTAPENCPSFEKYQYNKCPLHKDFAKLEVFPEDKLLYGFKKCRCTKAKRIEIANAFKLKNNGLFQREINALELKKDFAGIFPTKNEDTSNLQRDFKLETPKPLNKIGDIKI